MKKWFISWFRSAYASLFALFTVLVVGVYFIFLANIKVAIRNIKNTDGVLIISYFTIAPGHN